MAGINIGKMVVGGVVAGLVINVGQTIIHVFLFADQSAAILESMGASGEPTGGQIGMYWLIGFIIGMATIKIYVGFRPRFGAGMGTAIKAGVLAFTLAELVPAIGNSASGLLSFGAYLPFMIGTLVVVVAGGVAGAALYTEDGDAAAAPESAASGEGGGVE